MRKSMFVYIIISICLCAVMILPVSGEDDHLTESTALTMIQKALVYHKSLTELFYSFDNLNEVIEKDGINYRPVSNEYAMDNLIKTLKSIYTDELYNATKDRYSHGYLIVNNKSYFISGYAAQIMHYENTDEIDIKILSSDASNAVVEVKLYLSEYFFHNTDNGKGIINVFLTNTNNGWRISGVDYKYAVFSAKSTEDTDTLTEDWLCDMVLATVYDLFTYTRISASQIRSGLKYTEIYPGVDKPQVWRDYAASFCDSNISDIIINGSIKITFGDKALPSAEERVIPDFLREIPTREAMKDNLSLIQLSGENATATYLVPNNGNTLTFDLQKTSKGWKVTGGSYVQFLEDSSLLGINPNTDNVNRGFVYGYVICIALSIIVILNPEFLKKIA